MTKPKFNPYARRKARQLAMQGLYSRTLTNKELSLIEAFLMQQPPYQKVDKQYFKELLYRVAEEAENLDIVIKPFLDRSFDELDPIELNILRIGAYELTHRQEIPYKVVINEALELAKIFGAQDGHKYVNGILDKIAHQCREVK